MKDTQLTYILLIIASILLIANGIFAFERTLSMILMSILFILVGIILLSTTLNTMYQSSKHSNVKFHQFKVTIILLNIDK